QTYCFTDIDESGKILFNRFQFVTLQVSTFAGDAYLLVWCSCWANKGKDRTLRGKDFVFHYDQFFPDLGGLQCCIHTNCAINLFNTTVRFDTMDASAAILDALRCFPFPEPPSHQSLRTPLLYKEKVTLYVVHRDHEWIPATLDARQRLRCTICNRQSTK